MERLDDSQRQLTEYNLKFAQSVALPFMKSMPMWSDEIQGAAYLGLTEAAADFYSYGREFSNQMNKTFQDHARPFIERAIHEEVKSLSLDL